MTISNDALSWITSRPYVIADGATGTNLFQVGLETGYPPELWNVEQPEKIRQLHQSFVDAGSDLILTNSFGGTGFRLKLHQSETRVYELNKAAAMLARDIADKAGRRVIVAGSIGPTGELFAPLGAIDRDSAIAAFTEQAEALADGGADVLWIETMSALEEVEAATAAAKTTGLPVMATMTFDTAGCSMMGISPADYAQFAVEHGLHGYGANCGIGPAELMEAVLGIKKNNAPFLIAKGNCGIPSYQDGAIHYHGTPELMAEYAVLARDAGVKIIGGCCGTSPEHVAAMHKALAERPQEGDVDMARLIAGLGKPWKDLPTSPHESGTSDGASGRRQRRRPTRR
ncbi:MAG: Bifunctional homocysteine S-methyltransferase/5,10-methylenetetrahydrofolate reductase [Alphaproteobacteria bacterium UBA4588]|nr:MAG: Bifunctional homocysteine S-methyltransferase/5,10-methylenetetrahydrofolate reductase [Alphaproteobacteria bacterium UBA4588]